MGKIIEIRAHHFMCLPGYKGYNYGDKIKNNWDNVSRLIKEYPETPVKIINGPDTLCIDCPHNAENKNTCKKGFVNNLDETVKKLLGIKVSEVYTYAELDKKIHELLDPQKHAEICGDCMWRAYGLCKDTFEKVWQICVK